MRKEDGKMVISCIESNIKDMKTEIELMEKNLENLKEYFKED